MQLNRKVLPLKGYKSLQALNAYTALMIGMKMTPDNAHYTMKDYFTIVEMMSDEDKIMTLSHAARIVELTQEEVKSLISFCTDKNGMPYASENLKNLGPSELVEIIVTVCLEVMNNINIDLVSEEEKKKSNLGPLTSEESS